MRKMFMLLIIVLMLSFAGTAWAAEPAEESQVSPYAAPLVNAAITLIPGINTPPTSIIVMIGANKALESEKTKEMIYLQWEKAKDMISLPWQEK